ncbi:TPA: amino acid permease [Candidatus Woesearchaeota archaeon]|nr:amino acid permease [Candidatus Woesearchaeota archaeon]
MVATLKRELGLMQVTIAGVGIILGAGIYTLIGVASQSAGNATWLAFLISAFVAMFTGLSYAELSTMFKGDGGEFDYINAALSKKFAFLIGLFMIISGFISAATVALGFGGYFIRLFSIPTLTLITASIGLVIAMTIINFVGIRESSWFNTISTFIEFGGLILIILFGLGKLGSVDYFAMPEGLSGVFSASALVFFAYMGFESIVKLAEETKNPTKTIPRALILSLIITSVLYVLVAVSAVSILGWEELSQSSAPLASVAQAFLGSKAFMLLGIIALFSTANTVLISLVTTSRLMYGMAKEHSLPKFFAYVHPRTRTPAASIFILLFLTVIFVFVGDIEIVGNLTNLFLFLTFAAVNLSLIILRYKCDYKKRHNNKTFKCPINVGKFPVIALIGLLSSLGMMFFVVRNLMG